MTHIYDNKLLLEFYSLVVHDSSVCVFGGWILSLYFLLSFWFMLLSPFIGIFVCIIATNNLSSKTLLPYRMLKQLRKDLSHVLVFLQFIPFFFMLKICPFFLMMLRNRLEHQSKHTV